MRLLLASESPRRQELLKSLIREFAVESAGVEEVNSASATPSEVAAQNAALKASAAAKKHPAMWVLGADTVVALAGKCYGKPRDLEEAAGFLRELSGREHQVITAVSLQRAVDDERHDLSVETRVRFHHLSEQTIREYLAKVPVLDKAGAYGIQEHGEMLVASVDGEINNVIGLPTAALKILLEDLKIIEKRVP